MNRPLSFLGAGERPQWPGRNCLMPGKACRVRTSYTSAFPDPLKLEVGQEVTVGERESEWPGWIWCRTGDGKEGWVPTAYVERKANTATVLQDYDATELTAAEDELLTVVKEEAGWLWCRKQNGDCGWLPKANVIILRP
jgi:hypothetical protein